MPATNVITSGAYSILWNALNVGQTQIGGIRHRYSKQGREVKFDAVGDTPVDVIATGTRMFVDMGLMNYNLAMLSMIAWPWNSLHGTDVTAGQSLWLAAKPLVITSCRNDINPLTRTYYKAILATGFEVEQSFSGVEERVIPVRLMIFPVKYNAGGYATPAMPDGCGNIVYFDETLVA